VTCVACGGTDFARAPFHYVWEGRRFEAWRCRRCGLTTIEPKPNDEELTRLYAADYFRDGLHGLDRAGSDYETLSDRAREDWRRFLRREIRPRHPEARRFFEVGAAMGHMLAVARDEGFAVGGVEISAAAAERAREKFGIELQVGDLTGLDLADEAGHWDIVYAGDVLEHLRDPAAALAVMSRLLAPGGLVVVCVPTTLDLISSRLGDRLLRWGHRDARLPDPPYHLYEFTRTTARRLAQRYFGQVETVTEIVPFSRLNLKDRSPRYLAKAALHVLNVPLTRLTGRWGDRLTLYAREPLN